ncbi:MAG: hypothetical protein ACI9XU_000637, partial [Arenicella sp.]
LIIYELTLIEFFLGAVFRLIFKTILRIIS